MSYQPQEPYIFQSGKRIGQYLETLMFQDYSFLNWLLQKVRESRKGNDKNKLHKHLEWLLNQGENRPIFIICPHCDQMPIKFASVKGNIHYGYNMGIEYTCCENPDCRGALEIQGGRLLPIKFSSILDFRRNQDRDDFVNLLRQIHDMTLRLTPQRSFKFFSS